jgi:hypothetical protein
MAMDQDRLAAEFEERRPRLRAIATRLLGSAAEADDATERDIFTTLERIERRITRSEFKTASVPFDPTRHITMSDRRAEFARPIPDVMYRPITG